MENIAANRALASRYARALFDVAVAEGDPRAIDLDLAAFAELLRQYPPLRLVLSNRNVAVARKVALVTELTTRGHCAPPLQKLLNRMAERDHLVLIQPLADAYRRRVMDHLGIVQAQVTTAAPLAPDRLSAIERALAAATGKQVTMTTAVDPEIIGGVVARLDSTVYDGSVVRQLERIKAKMTEGA